MSATRTARIADAAKFAATEFGPLIAFWLLALTLGTKPAIAGAVAAIALDGLWRWVKRAPVTRLYLLVSALTLVFGTIDLMSASPFLLQYEAVATNTATGVVFVAGAFGEKPIIQEVAEQRRGESFGMSRAVRRFFQIFTLAWAAYFFIKAAVYAWMAATMPLMTAMALRSSLGGLSLAAMIAISVSQGPRLFRLSRGLGWLPSDDPPDADGAAGESTAQRG